MIVVPVLITSCQVSEKPKIGPVTAQSITSDKAEIKAAELPVQLVILSAKDSKKGVLSVSFFVVGSMSVIYLINIRGLLVFEGCGSAPVSGGRSEVCEADRLICD